MIQRTHENYKKRKKNVAVHYINNGKLQTNVHLYAWIIQGENFAERF